jgi:hypothetical protein
MSRRGAQSAQARSRPRCPAEAYRLGNGCCTPRGRDVDRHCGSLRGARDLLCPPQERRGCGPGAGVPRAAAPRCRDSRLAPGQVAQLISHSITKFAGVEMVINDWVLQVLSRSFFTATRPWSEYAAAFEL